MKRLLQFGGVLLLVVATTFASDQAATKPPAKGGVPKPAPIPKGADRLVNPTNPIVQLFHMTPEQRAFALERARPKQRENALALLEWFDGLPKEQQELQLRRFDRFSQLTPEKKLEVAAWMKQVNQLPPLRRRLVRQALYRLQQMSDTERETTMRRPMFQARFLPEDFKLVVGLADAWMGPIRPIAPVQ